MTNTTRANPEPTAWDDGNEFAYKTLCKSSIASVVFAILGLSSFLAVPLILLAILGAGFGILAIANIKRYPEELTGHGLARTGLVLSLVCVIASVVTHSIVYATEVPENHTRISFGMLKDNKRTSLPYSEKAAPLDGQKVFLKGYVRPGDKRRKLKEFILVGDFGDCCFGGNPEITDVVAIRIKEPDTTVDYGWGLRKIAGTFRLNKGRKQIRDREIPQIFYEIDAHYVR